MHPLLETLLEILFQKVTLINTLRKDKYIYIKIFVWNFNYSINVKPKPNRNNLLANILV